MKKVLLVASICLVAVVLTLTGCTGKAGAVYLSFNWTYAPDKFSTNDSHLPSTIYRNTDYKDADGSWWFRTYYWDSYYGVYWYYTLYYTLTAKDGGMFWKDGEVSKFQIYCPWDDYPTIAQTQNAMGEARSAPNSITGKQGDLGSSDKGKKVGEYTQINGGYELHVEIYTGSEPAK